jgi:hypothetical protein
MKFVPGDRVGLRRDLTMAGFKVPNGASGIVSNVHLQTSVLFDGFDHPLAIADNDLSPLTSENADPQDAADSPSVGDRVQLKVTKNIGGATIVAGSVGVVQQEAPLMDASWVLFDGTASKVLIPNSDLAGV